MNPMEDPMGKRCKPITLPGFWKPLAEREGSVMELAEKLGHDARTVRRWAWNERSMDAIAAAKIEEMRLPDEFFRVYIHPDGPDVVIASAPEGWVQFKPAKGGWLRRTAWEGNPGELLPGNEKKARAAGWPW
jgi:hypothetical protein